ncbi:hypothetical protein TIFTF001_015653 [Ficus carica]|uniref:Mitochondrial transcription termination factor family protein n=1 Tax=Ficus carica TaxID=3494 RepID=A0AA88D832_FICCA|nr:hypothetical protein TIFTF001_015653 [Ficus carica]
MGGRPGGCAGRGAGEPEGCRVQAGGWVGVGRGSLDIRRALKPQFRDFHLLRVLHICPPKLELEFFEAKGVSWPLFAKRLSSFPVVVGSSLAKQIRPSYGFFRNFLQPDEKAIATVERCPHILVANIEKYPRAFNSTSDWFRKIVEEVVEMGFDAKKLSFGQAVIVRYGLSKSMWENKANVFKKLDWSEEEVLEAFERYPMCMMLSEDKFMAGMDFFVGKMGLSPCLIAYRPVLLTMSLKKRLIPRKEVSAEVCHAVRGGSSRALVVVQGKIHQPFIVRSTPHMAGAELPMAMAPGLVKKEFILSQVVLGDQFLQKFVAAHEEEAPELLKLHKEKLHLSNGPEVDNKEC